MKVWESLIWYYSYKNGIWTQGSYSNNKSIKINSVNDKGSISITVIKSDDSVLKLTTTETSLNGFLGVVKTHNAELYALFINSNYNFTNPVFWEKTQYYNHFAPTMMAIFNLREAV